VQTAHEVLVALARRYAFGEVAALVTSVDGTLTTRDVAQAQQLCAFGQRLLDLDAEDFGDADTASGSNTEHGIADSITGDHVPSWLRQRALACRMPQSAKEGPRGALGSLRPAYRLLLEVIAIRFARRETNAVVAAAHIASEYGPLLVWERVLGHAGDPLRMVVAVGGADSAWGDFDDHGCTHTKPEKSAARRALAVQYENAAGWRTYLDRQHSSTSHALGVCAAACKRHCTVYTRLSAQEGGTVADGCRLAQGLTESALVKLRHSAPVGHGFGVPSRTELLEAWGRSRDSLARLDPVVAVADGFPLPGFAGLIGAMAGEPMAPDTLIHDTAQELTRILRA
jgi:hypothetical protein